MTQSTERPHPQREDDPFANLSIPAQPVDLALLKKEMEKADDQLRPFRTPVTEEVLNSIIS